MGHCYNKPPEIPEEKPSPQRKKNQPEGFSAESTFNN